MARTHKAAKRAGKLALFESFNFTCHYCGTEFPRNHPIGIEFSYFRHGNHLTADHIILKSKGGRMHPSNLVAACFECNNLRGDIEYEEFRKFMEEKTGRSIVSAAPLITYRHYHREVRDRIVRERQSICDVIFSDRHTNTSDN